MSGVAGLERCERRCVARLGQRAPRLRTGEEHFLVGRKHLGGFGHEMHPGEEDDFGVGLPGFDGQGQRVAQEVGDLLHFGTGIVVRQDHGVFPPLEFRNRGLEGRVVNHWFLFYFLLI